MSRSPSVPLPRSWSKVVRRSVLQALSVASAALTRAWSRSASRPSSRAQENAEAERLRTEVALLTEELELKDARFGRLAAHKRPHYGPVQRLRILELRALRGWSVMQTAERFLVTEETIEIGRAHV